MLDFKVEDNRKRIEVLEAFEHDVIDFIERQGIKLEEMEDQIAQNKIVLQSLIDTRCMTGPLP